MTNLLPVSSPASADTVSRQVNRNGLSTTVSSRGKSITTKSADTFGIIGSGIADVGGDIGIVPVRVILGENGTGDCILPDTGGVSGL
jgi:hypothetical protein